MAKDLKYFLKFDSNGRKIMQQLGVSSEQLDKALEGVGKSAEKTERSMLNMATATVALDGLASASQQLYGAVKDLSDAYAVQIEAETKLETVMRQRMKATDAQIQSIKDLTSAQQALGVIGDEIQLAGAQQLATFLNTTGALSALIPAMNNLVAQQKGLAATGSDAVNVGNLMGKAMQGQVSALKRVGITFDATQKAVMETGTEMERAAMLAEIITQNVGEMNAALAKTDAGKQKQLENALGDVKEKIGSFVNVTLPFLTYANQTMMLTTNVMKLHVAIGALGPLFVGLKAKILGAEAAMAIFRRAGLIQTMTGMGKFSAVVKSATIAVGGLRGALSLLGKATAVGAAIGGAVYVIDKLFFAADRAEKKVKDLKASIDNELGAGINFKAGEAEKFELTGNLEEDKAAITRRMRELAAAIKEGQAKIASGTLSTERVRGPGKKLLPSEYMMWVDSTKAMIDEFRRYKERRREISREIAAEGLVVTPGKNPDTRAALKTEKAAPKIDVSMGAENFTMLAQFDEKIKQLNGERAQASSARIAEIDREISKLKELRAAYENAYNYNRVDLSDPEQATKMKALRSIGPQMPGLKIDTDIKSIKPQIEDVTSGMREALEKIQSTTVETVSAFDAVGRGWGAIKGVTGGIQGLTDAITGNGSAWEKTCGVIDSGLQIMQSVIAITELVSKVTEAHNLAKQKEMTLDQLGAGLKLGNAAALGIESGAKAADISVTEADANANLMDAAAKTMNAHAWVPFAGIAIGAAAVATMLALMTSLPKFAKGGIAYGPTLGLFGEYPGAANNPEVVAPLSDLRNMLSPSMAVPERVELFVRGRNLVGVLDLQNNYKSHM